MTEKQKLKAKVMGCGDLKVVCPRCKRQAVFNMNGYDTCLLNAQEDDQSQVIAGGPGVPSLLHPDFVCRNLKCDYEATISFTTESLK